MIEYAAAVAVLVAGCGRVGFSTSGDGAGGDRDAAGEDIGGDGAGPPIVANIVFVTSTTQAPGSLGGLAGADAICDARASAAGLTGTYVAFLSTSTVDAIDRLAGARGWQRTDGRAFADDIASLLAGVVFYPPELTEFGEDSGFASYYTATGTGVDGRLSGPACNDWLVPASTGVSGIPFAGSERWLADASLSCSTQQRLYCFGIDRAVQIAPPTPVARRAFLGSPFTPGGGLAAADAVCASDASAAGLTGSFRALLASAATTAASRFVVGPWDRVDGVRFTPDLAIIESPLRVTANGTRLSEIVWTGASNAFTPGNSANTCSGWTSNGGNAVTGTSVFASSAAFDTGNQQSCGSAQRIYCLEE